MASILISVAASVAMSFIARMLAPPQEGPRLKDLKLHGSSYGGMNPIMWGTMRVPGNVIDESDLIEHPHKSGGKGGGPEVVNFTYGVTAAIRLTDVQLASIPKVWANGRLTFGPGTDLDFPVTFYYGTEDQLPDPSLEALHGVGNVPAYRGVAYMVVKDWDLSDYGNALPSLNALCSTKGIEGCEMRLVSSNEEATPIWGSDPSLEIPVFTGYANGQFRITSSAYAGGPLDEGVTFPTAQAIATYMYDATTLQSLGVDESSGTAAISADQFPRTLDFIGPDPGGGGPIDQRMQPLGVYVYADGTKTPLWRSEGRIVGGEANQNPAISNASMSIDTFADPITGIDFSFAAGVPEGATVEAAVFSGDGKSLFVFTGPGDAFTDHWYEITDGNVVRDGTVDPPQGPSANSIRGCFGLSCTGGPGFGKAGASFDNDGLHCWQYNSVRNEVRMYTIDSSGNFTWDSECGLITIPGGGDNGSILAYTPGVAAVVSNGTLATVTRYPYGATELVTLAEIVRDLSLRTGVLTEEQIDVSELTDLVRGYLCDKQVPVRDMIQPLRNAFFFDPVDRDGVVTFVKRGKASVVTIPDDDLAAHVDQDDLPPVVTMTRTQELDLPRTTNVNYANPDADYQTGTQTARRLATLSQQEMTLDLAISLSDAEAKKIADIQLYEPWVERERKTFYTTRKYAKYEPTDVVTVQGRDIVIRKKHEVRAGVIQFDGVGQLGAIYVGGGGGAVATKGHSTTPATSRAATDLMLLDIPLISDSENPNGLGAAVSPSTSAPWPGASIQKSSDSGSTYAEVARPTVASVVGATASDSTGVLGNFFGGYVFDELSSLVVVLKSGTLASMTGLAILNGANLALVGNEILQYRDAELIGPNTYLVTGFIRGAFGTESAMPYHAAGERFVGLPAAEVDAPFGDLQQERLYKAVTLGNAVANATAVPFTNSGNRLKPLSPVHLYGGSATNGDVTFEWVRRARTHTNWLDEVDVPLDEASEKYEVQIWDAAYVQCARIIEATSPAAVYTGAQQITDFGAHQKHIYWTVAQVGSIGLGAQARGVTDGTGATDDAVLTPIPPYSSGPLNPPPSGDVDTVLVWSPTAPFNTSGLTIGTPFVASFTAAADTTATISVAEYTDPPTFRHLRICTDAAGVSLVPGGESFGNTASATVNVTNGVTYYAVIKEELPDGSPSGTIGNDCDMIVQLSHP